MRDDQAVAAAYLRLELKREVVMGCNCLFFSRRWLNAIGLSLGLIGVLFIWRWGPPQPNLEPEVTFGPTDATVFVDGTSVRQIKADKEAMRSYYRFMSSFGLALILLGFLCQLANEIIPQDH
jgi:hypothetical protein